MGTKWRKPMVCAAAAAAFALGAQLVASGPAPATSPASGPATFTKDIAPIFQAKCQSCHGEAKRARTQLERRLRRCRPRCRRQVCVGLDEVRHLSSAFR